MFVRHSEKNDEVPNFIDLFAGAGGLSEGFIQAGFNPIAHVEMNEMAAMTLETRAAFHYLKLQNDDSIELYYAYERGEISREKLFEHIPEEVTSTIINEEMSDTSIKGIFRRIDQIMHNDEVNHVDVIIALTVRRNWKK